MLFIHHELAREASLVKPLGEREVVEHIFVCEACIFSEPSDTDISLALSLSARKMKMFSFLPFYIHYKYVHLEYIRLQTILKFN